MVSVRCDSVSVLEHMEMNEMYLDMRVVRTCMVRLVDRKQIGHSIHTFHRGGRPGPQNIARLWSLVVQLARAAGPIPQPHSTSNHSSKSVLASIEVDVVYNRRDSSPAPSVKHCLRMSGGGLQDVQRAS